MVLGQGSDAVFLLRVKTDNNRLGSARHQHVIFTDNPDIGSDNIEGNFGALDSLKNILHGLQGAKNIGFDHHPQHLALRGGDISKQRLQRSILRHRIAGRGHFLQIIFRFFCKFFRFANIFNRNKFSAGIRRARPANHADRQTGRGLFNIVPLVIEHGAHFSKMRTAHDRIADPEGASLNNNCGQRAATHVDL